jgi:hypothetical protein
MIISTGMTNLSLLYYSSVSIGLFTLPMDMGIASQPILQTEWLLKLSVL